MSLTHWSDELYFNSALQSALRTLLMSAKYEKLSSLSLFHYCAWKS